jgi:hypothetical protein
MFYVISMEYSRSQVINTTSTSTIDTIKPSLRHEGYDFKWNRTSNAIRTI